MFLFNHNGKASGNNEVKKYEFMQLDSLSAPVKKGGGTFQALYIDGGQPSAFHPLNHDDDYSRPGTSAAADKVNEKVALLEQEAYAKGFAQGEKDGMELGAAKSRKVIENIEALLDEIAGLRAEIVKHHEKDILEIICEIAERIVHHRICLDGEAIRETVMAAIFLATEKRTIRLKVNSDDYEYINRLKPEIFKRFNELKSIGVIVDHSIKRGGCYMETACGDVDARIETQMEKIRQSLEETAAQKANE